MPPNRKGTFDAVDSLATLSVSQFVEVSKFQPLTTAAAPTTTQTEDVAQPETAAPPQYEDPAKQALIERILLEEGLRERFSADHMVQSEQQHNEASKKTKTDIHREETDSDDYWAMTTPNDLESRDEIRAKTRDASYWDWPTQTKQQEKDALIQAILEQERIRQLFSVDHIVRKIQEEAAALQDKQPVPLPQNDSYWDWDAKVDLNDQDMQPDKEEIIRHILESEKLRQQFSASTLEEKLVQEAKVAEEDGVSRTVAANDDYWAGF